MAEATENTIEEKKIDNFVNLHVHSVGSLLDGMVRHNELVDYTLELGQPASCITDHGNLYSIVNHFQYAKKHGQKPIAGFEAYVVADHTIKSKDQEAQVENENKREHLLLLAKNMDGYKRLMKICSKGLTDGFYYRPRIDDNILKEFGTEGIIACSACFLEDTDVITDIGYKKIVDINKGDMVLTHKNIFKQVITKTNRNYSGDIYTIKAFGGFPIKCTSDHKFFILSKSDLNNYSKYEDGDFFNKNKKYITKTQKIRMHSKKYDINWTEAKDLKKGDFLLTPINETINNIKNIDVSSVFNEKYKKHIINYNISVTQDLLELLGIYCAEGSFISYDKRFSGITFTLNKEDVNIQEKVKNYMKLIFGLDAKIIDKHSGAYDFCYYSTEIANIFKLWFLQGAKNKKVPQFIHNLEPSLQMFFIKGLFLGDGHVSRYLDKRTKTPITRVIFATISKQLIYDITSIFHRNYINPSISLKHAYTKNGVNHKESYFVFLNGNIAKAIDEFIYTDNINYKIDINKLNGKEIPIEINGIKYMKYPLKYITKEYMDTKVFCLNVEDDHSFLANNVVVHNCFAGRVAQHIFNNRIEEAEKEALFYYELFNHDFYLEIQPTIDEKQVIVNRGLIELHKKTGIPMVATTDSHYLKREDSLTHDVLLCIQSKKLLSDPNRWKFPGDTYFVMSREEVINAFKCNGHETLDQDIVLEAINNTVKIANECNVELEFGKHYLPEINPPEDDEGFNKWAKKFNKEANPDNYLRYLCIKGLKEKNRTDKEYRDRLEYELEVITSMGFSSYFLIMEDLMTAAKNMDVKTGPARGCCLAESMVCLENKQEKLCNIEINDIVTGHDEKPQKVIKAHEYDCDEEIVKFDVSSKKIPGITKDHEIYAIKKEDYDKGIRIPKWYKSDELNIGDYIAEL